MTYAEYKEQKQTAKSQGDIEKTLTPYEKYKLQRGGVRLPQQATKKAQKAQQQQEKKRTWFRKGAFEDGYQIGDITRTILSSGADLRKNLIEGAISVGEKAVDALAYLAPYAAQAQFNQNGGYYHLQNAKAFQQQNESAKRIAAEFISRDSFDEEKAAKAMVDANAMVRIAGIDSEKDSVFGEKTDALVQAGGQMAATAGLQAVGVPWFVTSGATSFGGEAESALKQGASYEEAGLSAAVTAGTEMLVEKLSGGVKFGKMGTLDEIAANFLADKITNKLLNKVAKLGLDMVGEGVEEVVSGAVGKFGQWLTYQSDKTLEEIYLSEEALEEALESFLSGAAMGWIGNISQLFVDEAKKSAYNDLTNQSDAQTPEVPDNLDPKAQRVLQDYQRHQQQRDTIRELLQQEQSYESRSELQKRLTREESAQEIMQVT